MSRDPRAQPRAASALGLWENFPEQPPIVERCKRTCKAIALQQLVFRSASSMGRGPSLSKSLGLPPRKDLPQARYKKQRYLLQPCTLGTPSNKGLEPKYWRANELS